MRQFQVAQFINVEDRIVGPLTLRQFFYLLGGGAVIVLSWIFLVPFLFVLITIPVSLLTLALAFMKINGQLFPTVLFNGINYYLKPRLYVWKKQLPEKAKIALPKAKKETLTELLPKLTESRLKDLAWSLDIKEKVNRS